MSLIGQADREPLGPGPQACTCRGKRTALNVFCMGDGQGEMGWHRTCSQLFPNSLGLGQARPGAERQFDLSHELEAFLFGCLILETQGAMQFVSVSIRSDARCGCIV